MFQATFIYNSAVSRSIAFLFPESPCGLGPRFFLAPTSHAILPCPSHAFIAFPHILMLSLLRPGAPATFCNQTGGGEVRFLPLYCRDVQATLSYNSAVSQSIAFILPRCSKPLLSIILWCPGQLPIYCRGVPSHFCL